MSLNIDVNQITEVLLIDGWHVVADESFGLDSYEYVDSHPDGTDHTLHGGGTHGVCATGFQFVDTNGDEISGPLTAIQAVKR